MHRVPHTPPAGIYDRQPIEHGTQGTCCQREVEKDADSVALNSWATCSVTCAATAPSAKCATQLCLTVACAFQKRLLS